MRESPEACPTKTKASILMACLLAGFAWLVLHPHEPVYQEKPLSFWFHEAFQNGEMEEGSGSKAETALLEMGADALPILKKMAGIRMSGWRIAWSQTLGASLAQMSRDPQSSFLHIPLLHPQEKQQIAFWGFKVLGAKARPAVPALARWLADEEDSLRV